MLKQRYNIATEFASPPDEKVTGALKLTPLGNNASKVATPQDQIHTHKPVRQKLYAIRTKNKQHNIVSERTRNCGCKTIGRHAEINFNPLHGSANVSNVETCSSVWQCPVCRAKIMQGRANQLREIQSAFEAEGGHTVMLTLTVPHYKSQSLDTVLGKHKDKTGLSGALARMRQHRAWRAFKEQIGYIADCRALETTTGNNGWHVHTHLILYTHKKADPAKIEATLAPLWADCCEAAGMERPNRHGVNAGQTVNDYLAKWGAPSELTSHHAKDAKNGNRTISELEGSMLTDADSVKMTLKEYYQTMKGRKLLTWAGHNMREQFLTQDLTDEQLATDEHGSGERLYIVAAKTWHQIHATGKIGQMLSMIETDRQNGLYSFLGAHKIDCSGVTSAIKDMPLPETLSNSIGKWNYVN